MKPLILLAAGGVLVAAVGGTLFIKNKASNSPTEVIQQGQLNQQKTVSGNAESTVNVVTGIPPAGVPLPTEENVVQTFFSLIDEGKPTDAVGMMSQAVTENDSTKQAWAVQFNAFESAKLTSIEASDKTGWTDTKHSYRVTLNATMKPESADEVIPSFGWDNGENTRWVGVVLEDGLWKITGIATGP